MSHYVMAIDLRRCAGCCACVVACQMQNNQRPGISWNKLDSCEWGEEVGASGRAYIPHACMQCDNPACVSVCPVGATARGDDGVTLIDYDVCIGCGACVAACPYGARTINDVEEYMFGASEPSPYEAYGTQRSNVAEKCTFCVERRAEGKLPACVVNCPGGARHFGDLDDEESDIAVYLSEHPEAVRIDETSLYYIPVDGMPEEALPTAASLSAQQS
jgi:molybdopterin-containing oxidoreductase family iron-sulfur binding subunit